VARRDAGNSSAGRVGIERDGDGVDETEVDDVEGDLGIVAIAQGGEDVGFGEWGGHGRWFLVRLSVGLKHIDSVGVIRGTEALAAGS